LSIGGTFWTEEICGKRGNGMGHGSCLGNRRTSVPEDLEDLGVFTSGSSATCENIGKVPVSPYGFDRSQLDPFSCGRYAAEHLIGF
jgi:hypothetical protein